MSDNYKLCAEYQELSDMILALERLNDQVEDTRIRQEMSSKLVALRLHLRSKVDVVVQDTEYLKVLQDACNIIQADANTEENYGSLCRIGSVLVKLKAKQEKTNA